MISYSSLTNTKLQVIKTSIILIVSHFIRCNYESYTCGNVDFLKNLLSLLSGFIFYNFIILKVFKKFFIQNKKIFKSCRNMLMYSSVILANYFIMEELKINQIIKILTIMLSYNIFSNMIETELQINTHKNFTKKSLVLNSINLNLFIILLDNFLYDNNSGLSKLKLISYISSFIFYLLVKKFIYM